MTISVNGSDVTDVVGANLKMVAGMRDGAKASDGLRMGSEVLELAESPSEGVFAGRHLELLRHSCYVDNDKFTFSSGSAGGIGRLVRMIGWKVLRPVLDWISHKQNNINAQIVHAMELEKKERDRQVARLQSAIDELRNARR